jgi:hypothetical protein
VFDLVWPLLQQAESLPVPPIPPEVEWPPEDEEPGDALADPTTRAWATNWRLDGDAHGEYLSGYASSQSTGNRYIDKLQDLYGKSIKSYSGSFRDAFAAARKELGSGGIFSWTDPTTGQIKPFTTKTKGEGQFANIAGNVVNYLRGNR